ncbi:MAG: hypothetical protein Q4C34_00505 [Bacteroidales bacterium]|nr:hypothetical protein [Bacteroidales bacterium]
MKKLISLLIIVMAFAVTGHAVTHETLLGVPIDGTLSQFAGKLSSKGVRTVSRETGVYTLNGSYSGFSGCEFYAFSNEQTGQTYKVDIYLPKRTSWRGLKDDYNKMVRQFRDNPRFRFDEEKSEFESPYREGDGDEIAAVKADKCNYFTDFISGDGMVRISISKFMQVKIAYYDFANFPSDDNTSTTGNDSYTGDTNTSGAMKFMGIPMRGNINSFAQRLVNEKGCRIVDNDEHVVSLRGTFTGKESEFYVFGTPSSNQVWKVTVYLPKLSTWSSIKNEYLKYKKEFDNKYDLRSSYDFFSEGYSEGVEGVEADECHYSAFYNAPGGTIMLKISKYMQVQMSYEDASQLEIRNRENGSSSIGNDI